MDYQNILVCLDLRSGRPLQTSTVDAALRQLCCDTLVVKTEPPLRRP